jgi:hypothetical protein
MNRSKISMEMRISILNALTIDKNTRMCQVCFDKYKMRFEKDVITDFNGFLY